MRIGASTLPALPSSVAHRRDDIVERSSRANAFAEVVAEAAGERETTRNKVRSATPSQQAESQLEPFLDSKLPSSARAALLSYSSNGPSIEERLGVELAGIDVYA